MANPRVPAWAQPLSPARYALLRRRLKAACDRVGVTGRMTPEGMLDTRFEESSVLQVNVANMIAEVMRTPDDELDRVIGPRFDAVEMAVTLIRSGADHPPVEGLRERLRAKIDRPGVWDAPASVVRELAPGIAAVLVEDHPRFVSAVTRQHLELAGMSVDEAWEVGIENLAAEPRPTPTIEVLDGVELTLMGGDDYGASRALILDRLLPPIGPAGWLVSMPVREVFVAHPIQVATFQRAAEVMYGLGVMLGETRQKAISPAPYWWHGGTFEPLVAVAVGGALGMVVPEALGRILAAGGFTFTPPGEERPARRSDA